MESRIHHLEKEAYFSVLRAFKAQADAITWEKEGLITELRKELRVSDDEHRELLGRVNNDDVIHRVREWRQAGRQQGPVLGTSQTMHDLVSSPSFPVSRKKQKISQQLHSVGVTSSNATPLQKLPLVGTDASHSRKSKPCPLAVHNGNNQYHGSSGLLRANEIQGQGKELIGKTLFTRWPDDNTFYEAYIFNYDVNQGLHALVYNRHTPDETWEWVDLKQMPPGDIRWVGEDPGISHRGGHGSAKSTGLGVQGVAASKELDNGIQRMTSDDIKILHTETLVKQVEKVVAAGRPDLLDIEKAKKMLNEHEQSLIEAISRLTYISDGDIGDGEIQI
ncbi:hypothetical protein Dimus_001907 [Dionaea muscipula]